jgi:ribokinase
MTAFVIGNVTEDLLFGLPRLPRPGETLIAGRRLSDLGGKGLNQAVMLSRAGCPTCLLAPVGDDEVATRARALAEAEIGDARLLDMGGASDQSIICVAEDGENHIVSSAFAADALRPDRIRRALSDLGPGDVVVVQGNLSFETTRAALQAARLGGAATVANPSPIRWPWTELYPLVDLVIVNRAELSELGGSDDIATAVARLKAAGAREVVVTLGAKGAEFHGDDGVIRAPAVPVRTVDTAGAGDTFCGILVAARQAGLSPEAAMAAAARAAALTVGRAGTYSAFPGPSEIYNILHERAGAP